MREMFPWLLIVGVVAFLGISTGMFGGRDTGEAHQLVADGATLVDVRTPAEYAAGHIDGAINIPVDQLSKRLGEIPKDEAVVVYCHSGSRSAAAARTLESAGYARVEDIGGMRNW